MFTEDEWLAEHEAARARALDLWLFIGSITTDLERV